MRRELGPLRRIALLYFVVGLPIAEVRTRLRRRISPRMIRYHLREIRRRCPALGQRRRQGRPRRWSLLPHDMPAA